MTTVLCTSTVPNIQLDEYDQNSFELFCMQMSWLDNLDSSVTQVLSDVHATDR